MTAAVAAGLVCLGGVQAAEAKDKVTFDIIEVDVQPAGHWTRERLLKLVPELEKEKIDLAKLSHQIQLVNDAKAVKLNVDLQPQQEGKYRAVLTAEPQKESSVIANVNNTGNEFSGDWRLGTTYINKNISGNSDSLGIAYVTSPGHWEDVKQAALVYRAILPRAGDSLYVSASWSDVDLGNIGNFGGIRVSATGRGTTAGAHYQHNIKYTDARKQILDLGVDYKNYKNNTDFDLLGIRLADSTDYEVALASLSYVDIWKQKDEFLAWSLGYSTNLSSGSGFVDNRANSDRHFQLWKASLNYQRRLPGDWIIGVRGSGQYSHDNVVTTEQFGAGGLYSVRGFKERVAYADKGVMGSLEIYTPKIAKYSRFVLFTDWAHLSNNEALVGEIGSDNIGSYGVGYRFYDKKRGWSLSVDYAHAYSNLDGARNNLRPWHVNLTKEF